jgi:glycerol-3-phosphate dehydrogenase
VHELKLDTVIFGAGITGLWTLNRLKQEGYQAVLLENKAIGAGQTGASQGIIHGGMKYALTGKLSAASQAIADMPNIWRNCLNQKGEIDLSKAKILSEAQYLWSDGKASSKITGFFASKLLKSRCQLLKKNEMPELFQDEAFKGQVYQLNEMVLDIESVLTAFSESLQDFIFKSDDSLKLHFDEEKLSFVEYKLPSGEDIKITANHFVFCAGEGNAVLLKDVVKAPEMQKRPLRMTILTFKGVLPIYAHSLGTNANPRVTITSHQNSSGDYVWYVGGQVAEEGVSKNEEEHHEHVISELKDLMPWINFENIQISSFLINRAEPKMPDGKRPDNAFVRQQGNIITVWPTKLAFAPVVVNQILGLLEKPSLEKTDVSILKTWPKAIMAQLPWNQ